MKRLFKRRYLSKVIASFTLCCNIYSIKAAEKINQLSPTDSVLPMFIGLLAVLVVIFSLAFIFKKFTNFVPNNGSIKVLESQMIGNKEKLLVVEVGQQQFFLGLTSQGISALGELERNNKIGRNKDEKQAGFSNLFSQIISGKVVHLNQPSRDRDSSNNDSSAHKNDN